jgi:hypothetical protein
MDAEVSQIERKHIVAIKPTLTSLALYEVYAKPTSNNLYTKTINLVALPQ